MAVSDIQMTVSMREDDQFITQKLDYFEGGQTNPGKFYVGKDLSMSMEFMAFLRL